MRVAIVGCGQLGSRHGQALAKHPRVTAIALVDPSIRGLALATERVRESGFQGSIETYSSATQLSKTFKLTIISTSSKERAWSLREALESSKSETILLEKLLAPDTYLLESISAQVLGNENSFWVNCPRPFYPHFQNMQREINIEKEIYPVFYEVSGTNLGLASNSIHYLDHFHKITSRPITSTVFDKDLKTIQSKRDGYKELLGSFTSRTEFGDELRVKSTKSSLSLELKVTIRCGEHLWEFDEQNLIYQHRIGSRIVSSGTFEVPLQSQLTNLSLERLEDNETPFWSDFNSSLTLHKHLFEGIARLRSIVGDVAFT